MTVNSSIKKYLSLDNVRIYHNTKNDTFEITGKSSDIDNGFLMNVPQDSKMEEKLRKAFGLKDTHTREMPMENAFISYHESLKQTGMVNMDPERFENPEWKLARTNPSAQGKVIAVASPREGAGKTTVTGLLAGYLSHAPISSPSDEDKKSLKVCIVETGWAPNGLSNITMRFGEEKPNALDLFLQEDNLDAATVSKYLIYDQTLGTHVLLGVPIEDAKVHCGVKFYQKIVEILKEMFDVIIMDISENDTKEADYWKAVSKAEFREFALTLADQTVLVTDLSAASVYELGQYLTTAYNDASHGGYGVDPVKVNLVVNKYIDSNEISIDDINRITGQSSISASFPWDDTFKEIFTPWNAKTLMRKPDFESNYLPFIRKLMKNIGVVIDEDVHFENKTKTAPNYFNGHVFFGHSPNSVVLGITANMEFPPVDLKDPRKANIMVTGKKDQGAQDVIDNIRAAIPAMEDPYEVITYGIDDDSNGFSYGQEERIDGNLELLILLRKISLDMVKGVEYSVPKFIILGSLDEIVFGNQKNGADLSRVDKAVRAEILDLLRSLSENNSTDTLNFLFHSENPSSVYNSLLSNCGTHIHLGITREEYRVRDFLSQNIDNYPFEVFDDKKGRAFVNLHGRRELVQVLKHAEFKGDIY
jgi:septum formation inhibitor-activating ATPase MinD